MCGRFGLAYPRATLLDWYQASAMPEIEPRYNIAPTTDILVVRDGESGRTGSMMRWGLIPYWANDTKKLPLLHNARAETVAVKPLFKNSFRRRRVLFRSELRKRYVLKRNKDLTLGRPKGPGKSNGQSPYADVSNIERRL